MMRRQERSSWLKQPISAKWAIAVIIASIIPVSGPGFWLYRSYRKWEHQRSTNPKFALKSFVFTGLKKNALPSDYLTELMDFSADLPVNVYQINTRKVEEKLLSSPLVKEARVSIRRPSSLYIDYSVRRPVAMMGDFENMAIDDENVVFPLRPFLSPKKLPEIYVGLAPFGVPPDDPEKPIPIWHTPLRGRYIELAKRVIRSVESGNFGPQLELERVDVSSAFAPSYGRREIVVSTSDVIEKSFGDKVVCFRFPRLLRLSTRNYAQELGNYRELRQTLLAQDSQGVKLPKSWQGEEVVLPTKTINFRISKLAFINEEEN